ncbi:MAG: hypothetical protein ABSF76_18305 [Opitutaceae bacterium]
MPIQPLPPQILVDRVDPVGNDERRALAPLGEEVTHRPVERASHPHPLTLPRHKRERAVDFTDRVGGTVEDARAGLLDRNIAKALGCRIDEIDELFDVFVHGGKEALGRIMGAAGADCDPEGPGGRT